MVKMTKPVKKISPSSSREKSNSLEKSSNTPVKKKKEMAKPQVLQGVTPKSRRNRRNVLKEIKYFQKNIGFLIPQARMIRIVKEIVNSDETRFPLRFTSSSFSVLQEAFENYVVRIFEYALLVARHAKRVTIYPSDINLVLRIKNDK